MVVVVAAGGVVAGVGTGFAVVEVRVGRPVVVVARVEEDVDGALAGAPVVVDADASLVVVSSDGAVKASVGD